MGKITPRSRFGWCGMSGQFASPRLGSNRGRRAFPVVDGQREMADKVLKGNERGMPVAPPSAGRMQVRSERQREHVRRREIHSRLSHGRSPAGESARRRTQGTKRNAITFLFRALER